MAMGFSTQTNHFKYCPPCFWLCNSYPRSYVVSSVAGSSSSHSSWASSRKDLRRRDVCALQSCSGELGSINTMFSSTRKFKQASSYGTMWYVKSNRRKDSKFHFSSSSLEATNCTKQCPPEGTIPFGGSFSEHIGYSSHLKDWNAATVGIKQRKDVFSRHFKDNTNKNLKEIDIEASKGPATLRKGVNGKVKSYVENSNNGVVPYSRSDVGFSGNSNGVRNTMLDTVPRRPNNVVSLPKQFPINNDEVSTGNGSSGSSMGEVSTSSKKSMPSENHIKLEKDEDGLNDSVGKDVVNGDCIEKKVDESELAKQKLLQRFGRIYENVFVVDNVSKAKEIVKMLTNQYKHLVHACDTEVAKIDVKEETPVDHGEITCFSIYPGPEADFGNGKSCVWVDVLDGGGKRILSEFAPFFEDPSIKKVWHNYSFDSHVIENYGLKVSGFHADTMHMARLWDSSRRIGGGYSLEALTSDPSIMRDAKYRFDATLMGKISMKAIFGRRKVKKDGSEGKVITIPPVEELQRVERKPWICYSAYDSISTLELYESLRSKLSTRKWKLDGIDKGTMFDFYENYWVPFGDLLVKMETEGMLVDRAYLAELEKVAKHEQQVAANRFRNWASKYCPDAKYMNVGSDTQLRVLFFGGTLNRKDPNESIPEEKEFKVPNVDRVIEEGKKVPTKYRKITLRRLGGMIQPETFTVSGWPSVSGDVLRTLSGKVSTDFDFTDEALECQSDYNGVDSGDIKQDQVSDTKRVSSKGLDTSVYGTAYNAFKGEQAGVEACHAIAALCDICSIDTLISNFILPLQGTHVSGKDERIHCSLNINTETGRLSARRPNLQNQPALEKDRYKIRQAFVAAPGNSLIVADYGQLELRILAHLANCTSMLDAFKAGGDFHSRTAMNMYPHIREAVKLREVLLEWDPQPGEDKPPVPLLKDAFGSERRKAKMLNFSIAYGKTVVGLSRDWKVSVEEASETVDRWYSDRQEVLKWQKARKQEARKDGCVHTLLGRARTFPSISSASHSQRSHIERAAINAPVQGSAADVAMCAMLGISKNARLKELGWRLLLQVHDEVILEGPTESAEVAKDIVVECMSKPFDGKNILKVDLAVDAKCAQNWYAAK